jgi:ATP-dependent exoDNAse (exonuclease V) beta subunit
LLQISNYYQSLGWHIVTTPFTFKSKFKGIDGWMAGETDMLGVDKDGKIHVIDFKTSYTKLGAAEQAQQKYELTKTYEKELS